MSDRYPRKRTAAERTSYVAGFAAGWKACMNAQKIPKRLHDQLESDLDDALDMLSATENAIRENE